MDDRTRLAIATYLDERATSLQFVNMVIGTPTGTTLDMKMSTQALPCIYQQCGACPTGAPAREQRRVPDHVQNQ